jgi:CRP-like cAMP-binding protein
MKPPQLMTFSQSTRLMAGIMHVKVKDDLLADQKGRAHVRIAKFSRDFLMRQYGTKALAESNLRDLVHSVQHYAADDSALQPRFRLFGDMLGLLDNSRTWSGDKVDFYLAFLARCLSIDQGGASKIGTSALESTPTRRRQSRAVISTDKDDLLSKSAPMPPNFREVLLREELAVKLSSALTCLELFVKAEGTRKELQEQVSHCSFQELLGKVPQQLVNLDEVMALIMPVWQDAEDSRVAQRNNALGVLFDESNLNEHGLLGFAELRQLSDKSSAPLTLDVLTTIFDKAAQISAEETGEGDEMESITRDAFIQVSLENNLFELAESHTFTTPRSLVAAAPTMPSTEGDGLSGSMRKSRLSTAGKGRPGKTMRSAVMAFNEAASAKKNDAPLVRIEKPDHVTQILRSALRQNFLFKHLDESIVTDVIAYMAEQTVRVGDVVIKEGTSGDFFYVAESGGFEVLVKGERVHEYVVSKNEGRHPGFGELALMYSKPRAASVVATSDGVLWKLGRSGFRLVQAQANVTDPYMVLRKVEFFRGLRFDQMQQLRDHMREIDFGPGEVVFSQGEIGDGMYIIAKGQVTVHKREASDSREVMTLGANTYFGERALLRNEPRAASITAVDDVKTLFISREEFEATIGPLQEVLDEDRRKREHLALARQHELEAVGLANATRSSFQLEAPVTRVACGEVYLATHLRTLEKYTLRQEGKEAILMASERDRVTRETAILKSINEMQGQPAFLPSLLRAFETHDALYHLFKGRAVCNLDVLLEGHLTVASLRFVGACIVSALDVLHNSLHLLYRNIMPDNISLLDNGYVCLMDFRFCARDMGSCRTLCGSPLYFSPEMVRGETQSAACDLWSLGVLLYELAEGEPPWGSSDQDDMTVLNRITSHEQGNLLPFSREEFAECESLMMLIEQLLDPNPRARSVGSGVGAPVGSGAASLREHPFFAGFSWSKMYDSEEKSPLDEIAREQHMRRIEDVDWEEPELIPCDDAEDFFTADT